MPPIPYCGAPPPPGGVTWNFDPVLIVVLLACGAAIAWGERGRRRELALAGWALASFLLVSPLCNLSVALFSARVAQHLALILLAAPLLSFAAGPRRDWGGLGPATLLFAGALWIWHLPGPYLATFASHAAYWAMQASLLGTATWLWAALRGALRERPEAAFLAVLATAAQMAPLGALLTLSPRPFFAEAHRQAVTLPWGLTPLEDQQLGGLLMWVPGGLLLVLGCVACLAVFLRPRATG